MATTATPTDTALYLAVVSASLQRHAVQPEGEHFPGMQMAIVGATVKGFLDAFRSALQTVVPRLDEFKRNEPVRHAGVSGATYHEVVCQIARKQYEAIWMRVDPKGCFSLWEQRRSSWFDGLTGNEVSAASVIEEWIAIAGDFAELSPDAGPIDGEWLSAGLQTDVFKGRKPLESSWNFPRKKPKGDNDRLFFLTRLNPANDQKSDIDIAREIVGNVANQKLVATRLVDRCRKQMEKHSG